MNTKKRSMLLIILTAILLLTSIIPVFADGEMSEDDRIKEILNVNAKEGNTEILIFGDKLNSTQMDELKKGYNVYGKNIKTIYISNQEERDALLKYVPEKVVGTRAISSAYIRLHNESEQEGIQVKTQNITWVTEDMYRNALATAGVKNATILVSAPFPVSGTAALTGTVKAYEELTGNHLSDEGKDVANEEIIKTVELSDEIGDKEAEKIMSEIKYNVIEQDLKDPKKITLVVEEVAENNGVALTDKQIEEITKLMERIGSLDLNVNDIKSQLSDIIGKLENIEINTDEAKSFLSKILQAIKDFFSRIFNSKNSAIVDKKDPIKEDDRVSKDDNVDDTKEVKDEESKNNVDVNKDETIDKNNDKDKDNDEDAAVEEIVEPDNSIFIKMDLIHEHEKLSKKDFPGGIFKQGNSNEVLTFRPNVDLDNLTIVEVEFEEDSLIEKEVVHGPMKLDANKALGLNVVVPEGIPMLKIKWEKDGKPYHYDISYNGKDGMDGTYIIMN